MSEIAHHCHVHAHCFRSGNTGRVILTYPLPCRADVDWRHPPSAEDLDEKAQWYKAVAQSMEALDGKPHKITCCPQSPAMRQDATDRWQP